MCVYYENTYLSVNQMLNEMCLDKFRKSHSL
jgi:hypothetical protein